MSRTWRLVTVVWLLAVSVLLIVATTAHAVGGDDRGQTGWYLVGSYSSPTYGNGAVTVQDFPVGHLRMTRAYRISAFHDSAWCVMSGEYGSLVAPAGANHFLPSTALPSTIATSVTTGYGYMGGAAITQIVQPLVPPSPETGWNVYASPSGIGWTTASIGGENVARGFGGGRTTGDNYSSFQWLRLNPTSTKPLSESYSPTKHVTAIGAHVMFCALWNAQTSKWDWKYQVKDVPKLSEGSPEGFYINRQGSASTWPAVVHQFSVASQWQQVKYPTITGPENLSSINQKASLKMSLVGSTGIYQTMNRDAAETMYEAMEGPIGIASETASTTPDVFSTEDTSTAPGLPAWINTFYQDNVAKHVQAAVAFFAGWLWPLEELGAM